MWRLLTIAALLAATSPAAADQLIAARTLRARTVIVPEDLALRAGDVPGVLSSPSEAIGLETRAIIYAGRVIRSGDLGEPAIIERNQTITLIYDSPTLEIRTEGRALDRAGIGETLRVMNTASRAVVTARLAADGSAHVTQ